MLRFNFLSVVWLGPLVACGSNEPGAGALRVGTTLLSKESVEHPAHPSPGLERGGRRRSGAPFFKLQKAGEESSMLMLLALVGLGSRRQRRG